ncbi:MAG: hypothetical protein ACT4PT_09335 [Methanobacteriota archaeon]
MQIAYVERGDPDDVSKRVAVILEALGAEVAVRTPSHLRFRKGSENGRYTRGGYIGTYQPVGEGSVEVRIAVQALVPARLFWSTVGLIVLTIPLLVVARLPSTGVVLAGVLLYGWFLGTLLLYVSTFHDSLRLERRVLAALVEGLSRDLGARVLTEEDAEELAILEAERARRDLTEIVRKAAAEEARRKAERKSFLAAFGIRRTRAPAQSPDEIRTKLARLQELRAKLAERKKNP